MGAKTSGSSPPSTASASAGPPSVSNTKGFTPNTGSVGTSGGMGPMHRKTGGQVNSDAQRQKAIADALHLIAQSPEFGALLRRADGELSQQQPGRRS